jgi:hypothetical protein
MKGQRRLAKRREFTTQAFYFRSHQTTRYRQVEKYRRSSLRRKYTLWFATFLARVSNATVATLIDLTIKPYDDGDGGDALRRSATGVRAQVINVRNQFIPRRRPYRLR